MASKKAKPESLSDQIRRAVRECGASNYALAKQIGVSESTLSRFLSGERGMTLDAIDRLAEVLGLQIVTTVQMTTRSGRRGPKPKRESAMVKTEKNWKSAAEMAAWDAHENYFSSRRGVWFLRDFDALCLYNNNPYAQFPKLRGEETAKFREWLKANGIKELAYAEYPLSGESKGYTFAMVIDAGEDRQGEVANAMQEILSQSLTRMSGEK